MVDYKQILLETFSSDLTVNLEQTSAVSVTINNQNFSAQDQIPVSLLWKQILEKVLRNGVMQPLVPVVQEQASEEENELSKGYDELHKNINL